MFRFLPEQASKIAPEVDRINNLITDLSVFFTVLIVGAMIYFAIKYRKRADHQEGLASPDNSHKLEFFWTIIPIVISAWVAVAGLRVFTQLREVPEKALEIMATGKQWLWEFEYKNGKKTKNEIYIPVDTPVKFVMTSTDVLHSFFVPAMRVKSDVIPGRYTYVSFTPVKTGSYHVFCTEYCGKDHSSMLSKLHVLSKADYERWLNDKSEELIIEKAKKQSESMNLGDLGAKLYTEKGCNACHSLDGSRILGPSFLKIWNKEEDLDSGEKVLVDENYIKESILYPAKKIVKTFGNQMMSFEGQLSDREISGLIEFIKSQDGSLAVAAQDNKVDDSKLSPSERGANLAKTNACSACHSLDGSKLVGPSWKGIYGRSGKLQDGTAYVANDEYITKSIMEPSAQVVEGYPAGAMPANGLSKEQVQDIIEYMKTLK